MVQFLFLFVLKPSIEVTAVIHGLSGSRDPVSVMIRSAGWERLQTQAKFKKKSLQCSQ